MSDLAQIRKALVQKLESLHRSGVREFPRTVIERTAANTTAKPDQRSGSSADSRLSLRESSATVVKRKATLATGGGIVAQEPRLAPALHESERSTALQVLAEEAAACTRCQELVSTRKQTVFGVGSANAKLLFFGEAPGADEDRLGEPFVGRAGQLLTKIIEACKLKREDVYIMNVLKCRPPTNRNPTPEEGRNCRPFFEKQFEIIQPEFICCLGAIAASTLLETTTPVGRLRGRFHDWRGIRVMVTYHPSYLLRTPDAKRLVWADMKMLMNEMGIPL